MLQGDGWGGFEMFAFDSGERRTVKGIVLSNSCDISLDNPRDVARRVTFAPLVRLSTYCDKLLRSSRDKKRVNEQIESIRAQKTSNIFYIPAGDSLKEDYIARLDDTHSMPVNPLLESANKEKLFTLSNTGFYMLILKLSVHFCRLQENLNRKN